MAKASNAREEVDDEALLTLCRAIARRDDDESDRLLAADPGLARATIHTGATRQGSEDYFLDEIRHHVYRGDTALHIAGAAARRAIAASLLDRGADVRAANRRGATPLHYAADGRAGSSWWDPDAQRGVIDDLLAAGADPEAVDRSGVVALHRAVRTRSPAAVRALLAGGADPVARNGSGSTPLHLAVQNTGASGSGSDVAHAAQREIILVLLEHGARPNDADGKGTTVADAATSDWVRALLPTGA